MKYMKSYLIISFYLQRYLNYFKLNDNLTVSGHRKIWILRSVELWQTIHDLRMKLNQASPRQKQHYTRRLFDQKIRVRFKAGTRRMLRLDDSFVWGGNLESCKSRSELFRTFWNVVLQKRSGDQLDWSFKKLRCIPKNGGEGKHPKQNKTKQTKLDKAQIHDIKPTKCT
jgi:hypothetical protein